MDLKFEPEGKTVFVLGAGFGEELIGYAAAVEGVNPVIGGGQDVVEHAAAIISPARILTYPSSRASAHVDPEGGASPSRYV